MDDTTNPNVSTFDVFSFIEKTEYPVDTVSIFTDTKSAKEYVDAKKELDELSNGDAAFDPAELEKRIEDAADKLKASSLTFELRGYAPGVVEEIMKLHEDDETGGDYDLIARAIIGVRNIEGAKDSHIWSAEEVKNLKGRIAENEYFKLLNAVAGVIFTAALFDQAVDAGFPG